MPEAIHSVWQVSYPVEAKILQADDFPPLKRTVQQFEESLTDFYGFYEGDSLAGIIEILVETNSVHLQSLVVRPEFFRRGIGRKLVHFAFQKHPSKRYTVETGAANLPACRLYESSGFKEIKEWETEYGIRKVRFELRGF